MKNQRPYGKGICFAALLGFFLLAGCASTHLPPVGSPEFAFEEDEKRLWNRAKEEQTALNESGLIYQNKALNAYLNRVTQKLASPELFKIIPFQVKVIKNPQLNAFAYPNGTIYIHTGMLARMENEAQLAALLSHEMTHSTHRHAVRGFRGLKNKSAFRAGMRTAIGDLGDLMGSIGMMASVSGYSRALETEADREGFKRVVQAGYDPREAAKLFTILKEDVEEKNTKEPFFFGTHPKLQARIQNYQYLTKALTAEKQKGVKNPKTFSKKTQKLLIVNARLNLEAGRFRAAQQGIEKYLVLRPKTSLPHYLLGEISRERGETEDFKQAKAHYRKAISLNSKFADPYKGLGLIQLKEGKKAQAKKSFKSYLAKAPKAKDRKYILEYLKQIR